MSCAEFCREQAAPGFAEDDPPLRRGVFSLCPSGRGGVAQ